jgi:penicillin amidase
VSAAPGPAPARRAARRRLQRTLFRAAAALVAGIGLAALGLAALRDLRAERSAFPIADGRLAVAGPARAIEISRDARGTPHVEAESESDAYFGLGFAHAQDRLAQMVWLARSARGRAAELVGESALAADRRARTLGIARAADEQAARLDPATRSLLDAYAAGVRAWTAEIEAGRVAPPLALARAGARLEPWSPADSIAIVKAWAWGLGGTLEASLLLSDMIEQLGGFEAGRFFPEAEGLGQAPSPPPETHAHRAPAAAPLGDPLRAAFGLEGRGVGSSAWVVGGRLAAGGLPLLVADTHLEATAPAFYHEAHVRGGELDVAGATIPGVPVFWSGRNRDVAWGATAAGAVVGDLYVETLSQDGERAHDGARFTALRAREEEIAVRGADTERWRVRETRHGPLVNPLIGDGREPLALAWTGARPGDGIGALLRAARATSAGAFRGALAAHHEPVLAFVFADVGGAAGLQVAGSVPRRELATSLAPVPGRSDDFDWRGFVPFEALPASSLAPGGGGWLVAADAPLAREGALRGEWLHRGGARARRIAELLGEASARGPLELRDLARMQLDTRAPRAGELLEKALALAGDGAEQGAESREVVAQLRAWDGHAATGSQGAALFHLFRERLVPEVLARRLPPELLARYLALREVDPVDTVVRILGESLDPRRAEALAAERAALGDAVRRSLRESWLWLSVNLGPNREKWGWGRLHTITFRPLGAAALLGEPEAALGPFPCDGDESTIAAAAYDRGHPFGVQVASTYRWAVDTATLDQALSSLVPGASEHPGHAHRADGVERWLAGRPRVLVTSRLLIDETARARLVLEPAPRAR